MRSRAVARAALWAAALAALFVLTACRGAVGALGPTPDDARRHADELFGALAARFGPVQREPEFASVRPRLARAALSPSRAFRDRSIWTAVDGTTRGLEFVGRPRAAGYRLGIGRPTPAPVLPGEYRGVLRLQRLGSGEYEWRVRDELAVGSVRADALAAALTSVFRAAEATSAREARVLGRLELPRTAAVLSRLFSLDSLRLETVADGRTRLMLEATLQPATLERNSPRYARFLRKHASPARMRAAAYDPTGARWWEAEMRANRLTLRLCLKDGRLTPLDGPPRTMPERLLVRLDFSTKLGPFRVGMRELEAEVAFTRAPWVKSFLARFGREPRWELPFIVKPFLRASLRRPFEGEGAFLGFGVQEEADTTLLFREYRLAVKESWLVRWLGGLMGGAVDEFRREAEAEADRFAGEVLGALRTDVLALLERDVRTTPR